MTSAESGSRVGSCATSAARYRLTRSSRQGRSQLRGTGPVEAYAAGMKNAAVIRATARTAAPSAARVKRIEKCSLSGRFYRGGIGERARGETLRPVTQE